MPHLQYSDQGCLRARFLSNSRNHPAPDVIAAEIAEDLEAALEQFAAIAED